MSLSPVVSTIDYLNFPPRQRTINLFFIEPELKTGSLLFFLWKIYITLNLFCFLLFCFCFVLFWFFLVFKWGEIGRNRRGQEWWGENHAATAATDAVTEDGNDVLMILCQKALPHLTNFYFKFKHLWALHYFNLD